jgi:predicted RNase H-like HicB family nuclease
MGLTAVFMKGPEGDIAFVEALPGTNSQAATLDEARDDLREAVALVLEANRETVQRSLGDQAVTREPLVLSA